MISGGFRKCLYTSDSHFLRWRSITPLVSLSYVYCKGELTEYFFIGKLRSIELRVEMVPGFVAGGLDDDGASWCFNLLNLILGLRGVTCVMAGTLRGRTRGIGRRFTAFSRFGLRHVGCGKGGGGAAGALTWRRNSRIFTRAQPAPQNLCGEYVPMSLCTPF